MEQFEFAYYGLCAKRCRTLAALDRKHIVPTGHCYSSRLNHTLGGTFHHASLGDFRSRFQMSKMNMIGCLFLLGFNFSMMLFLMMVFKCGS